jgi:hypothetical protein
MTIEKALTNRKLNGVIEIFGSKANRINLSEAG